MVGIKNAWIEMTKEVWAFKFNDSFFEVHLEHPPTDQRTVTDIFKEKGEVTGDEIKAINDWVKTIETT